MGVTPLDDAGRHHQVAEGGVDAAADDHLIDLGPGHLPHRLDVAGGRGAGDQGFDPGKVDLGVFVVIRSRIGRQLDPGIPPPLSLEILPGALVGREDGTGGPEFRPHVADRLPIGGGKALHSGAVVLDDLADATLDIVAAQHLQDHVLGAHPVGEFAGEFHPQHFRAGQVIRTAGHGQGHVETAGADGEHGDSRRPRGVAVGAEHRQAGAAEALHMHLMRDAVSRTAEVDAVAGAGGLQVAMIVGVLVVGLQQVVVDVLGGQVDLHPLKPQGLELEHGHGPRRVLQQGVVDADGDLLAGDEAPLDQMSLQNLAGEIFCHFAPPFRTITLRPALRSAGPAAASPWAARWSEPRGRSGR